ncbi:MAG TPA: hypothetical protein VGA22_04710 [Gemmatimonadales bacterium]|jgi:hypothetical protein
MSRVRWVEHGGRQIAWLDFAGIENPDDAYPVIEEARSFIASQPEKSVLTLTDVTGSTFNADLGRALWRLARDNRPHVIAGAVIGIEGLQKDLFQLVTFVSRRPLQPFKTADAAMDWLVAQLPGGKR